MMPMHRLCSTVTRRLLVFEPGCAALVSVTTGASLSIIRVKLVRKYIIAPIFTDVSEVWQHWLCVRSVFGTCSRMCSAASRSTRRFGLCQASAHSGRSSIPDAGQARYIRPPYIIPVIIIPCTWTRQRGCFWPIFGRDQSWTRTTVDALVDHLPQDSSPEGSSPACRQLPLRPHLPQDHAACEVAPTDRDQPRPIAMRTSFCQAAAHIGSECSL